MQVSRCSGIKKIQRGVAAMTAATTLDISVSSVDVTKSRVVKCGQHYSTAGGNDVNIFDNECSVRLLNSTTIRIEKSGSNNYSRVSWELVENA
jgi:hypothetical protein